MNIYVFLNNNKNIIMMKILIIIIVFVWETILFHTIELFKILKYSYICMINWIFFFFFRILEFNFSKNLRKSKTSIDNHFYVYNSESFFYIKKLRISDLEIMLTQSAYSCSWSYSWKHWQTWLVWKCNAWVVQVDQDFACNPGNNDDSILLLSSILQ